MNKSSLVVVILGFKPKLRCFICGCIEHIFDTPDGILETLLDQLFAESAKHDLQQHLGG